MTEREEGEGSWVVLFLFGVGGWVGGLGRRWVGGWVGGWVPVIGRKRKRRG